VGRGTEKCCRQLLVLAVGEVQQLGFENQALQIGLNLNPINSSTSDIRMRGVLLYTIVRAVLHKCSDSVLHKCSYSGASQGFLQRCFTRVPTAVLHKGSYSGASQGVLTAVLHKGSLDSVALPRVPQRASQGLQCRLGKPWLCPMTTTCFNRCTNTNTTIIFTNRCCCCCCRPM